VREHYGFDDEDEIEIARVKGVSSLHSKGMIEVEADYQNVQALISCRFFLDCSCKSRGR